MDIEKRLKKFKRAYLETEPSEKFIKDGWQELQEKKRQLELIQAKSGFFNFRAFAVTTLIIFILLGGLGGVVGAAQNSLPGETLYAVRRLSEDAVSKVSGNTLIRVEGRAKDIVGLSKKGRSQESVRKAVEEYNAAVNEASRSGKYAEEIEKKLEDQEKEFEEIRSGPEDEEINEAIEISRSGRDENRQDEEDKIEEEKDDEDRSGSNSGEK